MPVMIPSPHLVLDHHSVGSACCVWTDLGASYVLSAAHVVEGAPGNTPVQWVGKDFHGGIGVVLDESMRFLPVAGGVLDAALVRIVQAGPFGLGGSYPHGLPVLRWDEIREDLVVEVCGKQGTEPAVFAEKREHGDEFDGHTHGRLLHFRFYKPGRFSDPGDSGAAVVSMPEQMLVGMHIALHEDGMGNRFSVVISAEDIEDAFQAVLGGFRLRP